MVLTKSKSTRNVKRVSSVFGMVEKHIDPKTTPHWFALGAISSIFLISFATVLLILKLIDVDVGDKGLMLGSIFLTAGLLVIITILQISLCSHKHNFCCDFLWRFFSILIAAYVAALAIMIVGMIVTTDRLGNWLRGIYYFPPAFAGFMTFLSLCTWYCGLHCSNHPDRKVLDE
jgi:hypothetical protein